MTRKLTPAQLDEIEAATIRKQVVHAAVNGEPDKRFATVLALIAEVRELRAKVERVRLLHEPSGDPEVDSLSTCDTCADLDGKSPRWPCDTIKALGEEA